MRRHLTAIAVLALLLTSCGSSGPSKATPPPTTSTTTTSAPSTTAASTVRVVPMSPPAGISAPGAQWVRVTRFDGETQLAAVYRPPGTEPHPVVVLFHGSSGLAAVQLTWAETLARKGYVVVAGCYLNAAAGSPPGVFLPCPGLPDGAHATAADIRRSYRALLDVAATLDGAKPDAIGVVGMSLGANVVLGGDDPRVNAIVADSGFRETAGTTKGPILLLGFTNDPNVPHGNLLAFEHAQRAANPIASHYYPGASHVALLTPSTTSDATARALAFLQRHVG